MDRRLFLDDLHDMPGLSPEEHNEVNELLNEKKQDALPENLNLERNKKKKNKKKKKTKSKKIVFKIYLK